MNRNKLKLSLLILILAQLFLAQAALAQQSTGQVQGTLPKYSGPQATIEQYLCAPAAAPATQSTGNSVGAAASAAFSNTTGGGNAGATNAAAGYLYKCINRLYRFAIILASVGAVLYIVVAGYMYMSAEGNQEMVDKAKSYVTSAITALAILFAGYIILRFINPDLIQFQNIQPPSVTPATVAPPSTTTGAGTPTGQSANQGAVSAAVQTAASTIQTLAGQGKLSVNSSSCDCAGDCPNNTLQNLASGRQAQTDGPGSQCATGYTSVSSNLLNALIAAANSGNSFSIGSITGGHHSSATDPHYQGLAVDITPTRATAGDQQNLIQSLQSNGASVTALECNNGSTYLIVPSQAAANSTQCIGQSGYHIHAQWPS